MDELTLSQAEAKTLGESEVLDIVSNSVDISTSRHPNYDRDYSYWLKWRLTYESGDTFLEEYLEKFSDREGFLFPPTQAGTADDTTLKMLNFPNT